MSMTRRRFLSATAVAGLAALTCATPGVWAQSCKLPAWEQWGQFARRHIQADGRVVDFSVANQQSTSEGQSYAMFFALVANDRERFASLWRWSRDNLGAGGPALPAWQWGRRDNGSYGVLDPNSASDADLWMAYGLLEAGRLWRMPQYQQAAMNLLAQIRDKEVVDLPRLGPMLLPGAIGFAQAEQWRLNPSYLPLPLLRKLARVDGSGPWQAMIGSTQQMIRQASSQGFAPDWIAYDARAGVSVDAQTKGIGSYDAIRVYLWAGVTNDGDPLVQIWRESLGGMHAYLHAHGTPPEQIDTVSGVASAASGPWGFSAALLPYLKATGQDSLLAAQLRLVQEQAGKSAEAGYYNSVLSLFGWGWLQGQYRFGVDGDLQPAWLNCTK